MIRINKSLSAICTWCRHEGKCYEVEADDDSIAGNYCPKCVERWIDARSGMGRNGKKKSDGKKPGVSAKAEATR